MSNFFAYIVKKCIRVLPVLFIITSIVIVSMGARLLYQQHFKVMSVNDDSMSYFYTGRDVWKTGILVNEWRPPLYGILITIPFVLSGNLDISIKSYTFFQILFNVTVLQVALGITGSVLLYFLFLRMNLPRYAAWLLSIVFAGNFFLLIWERLVLTMFSQYYLTILLALLLDRVIYKKNPMYIFLLTFVSICIAFIHPFLLGIPLIAIAVALRIPKRKTALAGIILSLFIYLASLGIYARANGTVTGYYGLSRIGTINLFGKILEYRLPIEAAEGKEPFYSSIRLFYYGNPYQDAWNYFKSEPSMYETKNHAQFADITRTIIYANSLEYIRRSVANMPSVVAAQNSGAIDFHVIHQENEQFVKPWQNIYRSIQLLVWISIIGIPFIIALFLFRPEKKHAVLAFGALSILYSLFVTVFFTYDIYDYGRYMVTVQPFLWGITVYTILILVSLIKKGRLFRRNVTHSISG